MRKFGRHKDRIEQSQPWNGFIRADAPRNAVRTEQAKYHLRGSAISIGDNLRPGVRWHNRFPVRSNGEVEGPAAGAQTSPRPQRYREASRHPRMIVRSPRRMRGHAAQERRIRVDRERYSQDDELPQ